MILDRGICTVFRAANAARPGEMPRPGFAPIFQGWYGELSFETSPARPTEGRTELKIDNRVRILQCRDIRQDDVVVLRALDDFSSRSEEDPVYRILRAYHGTDDKTAVPISDLSLEVYRP